MDSNKYMQDKYYTHDQFQSLILDKRPPGAEIKDIVDTFVKNGYTIEGVNAPEKSQEIQQPGFLDRLKEDLGKRVENSKEIINNPENNAIERGVKGTSEVLGGINDVVGNTMQSVDQTLTGGKVLPAIGEAIKPVAQPVMEKVNEYAPEGTPQRDLLNLGANALGVAGALEGAGQLKNVASKGVQTAKVGVSQGLETLAKTSKQASKEIADGLSKGMKSEEIASSILNRELKLNPVTGNKAFQDLSGGKLPGEYLVDKGIYGTREEIVNGLAKDWVESYNLKKETLKQLPDQYTFNPVNEALKDLVAYEKKTSVAGAKGTFTDRINELANIAKTRGLTLSEIDDVKNIYENTVKLGYNKMINPEGVQRATNLDNAIRKFVEDKASTQGFTNVSELNKNTQLSRFLAQAIEDKIAGQSSNNFLSLTDTIIGSSAIIDPSGLVVLAGKKLLSSEKVQSALAKKLGGSAKSKLNANVLQAEPALLNPKSPSKPDFYVAPEGSVPGQFESANKKVILNGLKTNQGTPQAETQVVSQSLSKSIPQTTKKASVKTKKK